VYVLSDVYSSTFNKISFTRFWFGDYYSIYIYRVYIQSKLLSRETMAAEMDITHSDSNGTSGDKYNAMKNFEIDKKIGKGQFSEVYRARCVVDNTIVALKKVQVYLIVVKKNNFNY